MKRLQGFVALSLLLATPIVSRAQSNNTTTAEDVKQSFPDGSRIAEKDGWQFHECGRPKK